MVLDQVVFDMASQKPQPSKHYKNKEDSKRQKEFTSEVDFSAKHLVTAAFKDIGWRYL